MDTGYWAMWSALVLFALVGTGTPGPNTVMLTASGANFGVRRTLPHIFGIASGVAFMLLLVGIAQHQAATIIPLLIPVLKWVSLAIVLFLAVKIATAGAPRQDAGKSLNQDNKLLRGRFAPLTFWQAAVFQWINPKAWLIAMVVTSQYIRSDLTFLPQLLLVVATFWGVTIMLAPIWAWFGSRIARFLQQSLRLHFFNVAMALLLVFSVLPAIFSL